jgi:polyphosphate kinase 2 (PPK2 family)
VLRQLVSAFDPCHLAVHRVTYDRREAADGHWLARFWRQLPGAGDTAIFFRSWYRRVLDDRILGRTDETAVARAFDEINDSRRSSAITARSSSSSTLMSAPRFRSGG